MKTPAWLSKRSCDVGRAKTVLLLVGLIFLFGCGKSTADEKTRAVRPPSQRPVVSDPEVGIGDLYALVVGVSKYRNPDIARLGLADKDARDFAAFLSTQQGLFRKIHVTLVMNEQATQQEVNKRLLRDLRLAGKNDTVVIFLAGHGADDLNKPRDFFFLAHDSDPKFPEATAINMSGSRFMERLDSPRVLLIADACHSGGFASLRTRGIEPSLQRFMRQMKETEGRLVLSASRADEVSVEKTELMNGVFTYYLLEGLKGDADANHDGVVTVQELYEYVYEKTKDNTGGIQHPKLEGNVVGKFPMSLVNLQPSGTPAVEPPKPVAVPQPSELDRLRSLAESGDAKAQFELGVKCEYGFGIPENSAKAGEWYAKAAAQGDKKAEAALGRLRPAANLTPVSSPTARPDAPAPPMRHKFGLTALSWAARFGKTEEVERLISEGTDPNERSRNRWTALHYAALRGNTGMVRALLDRGADLKARNDRGETALHKAAHNGHIATVQLLIDRGADISTRDDKGYTALQWARYGNRSTTVQLLIDRGAETTVRDKK